jgi:hypothetical protein
MGEPQGGDVSHLFVPLPLHVVAANMHGGARDRAWLEI